MGELSQRIGKKLEHLSLIHISYLFSRGSIGNSAAMFLMIGLMLPFFFFAMYERDGLPLEKVLKNIIRTRFLYPRVRPYKTENFYALLGARKEAQPIAKQQQGRKAHRQKALSLIHI